VPGVGIDNDADLHTRLLSTRMRILSIIWGNCS
jgi:hypothetical protein